MTPTFFGISVFLYHIETFTIDNENAELDNRFLGEKYRQTK
jgi:hypothetical protein